MAGLAFNILGSSLSEEVLKSDGKESVTVKGCVTGANPLHLSDGEKESILSEKAEWVLLDSVSFNDLGSVEDDDVDSLAKFLKKNWARKVILISAKPSIRCKDGRVVPYCKKTTSDSLCSALVARSGCYLVTIPSDCISRNGKPFCYVDETLRYLRSVIDVITTKYDRTAVERLAIDYCRDVERMSSSIADGIKDGRNAYNDAVLSKKNVEACSICGDLVSKGDMWAAPYAEPSYVLAVKECKDPAVLTGILRKFSNSGMSWAKYRLFDLLWKNKDAESDKEMIEVIRPVAAEGDGPALVRLSHAYRFGRGVDTDLDESLELMKEARSKKAKGSSVELFDIYWEIGTPEAYKKGVATVKPLADRGDVPSILRIARAYRYGKGVRRNTDKAMALYDKAAESSPSAAKERDVFKKNLAAKK